MDRDIIERDLDEYEPDAASWPTWTDTAPTPPPANADAAGSVLRRLRRLHREADEIVATAASELDRITRWRDDRLRGVRRDMEWGERALELFARGHLQGKSRRSITMPDGTVKLTKPQTRVEVTDEEAFTTWAKGTGSWHLDHGEFVRVKLEPDKTLLRGLSPGIGETVGGEVRAEALLMTGEVVPGIQLVTPAEDRFDVLDRDGHSLRVASK